jgi:hypothetical protein
MGEAPQSRLGGINPVFPRPFLWTPKTLGDHDGLSPDFQGVNCLGTVETVDLGPYARGLKCGSVRRKSFDFL